MAGSSPVEGFYRPVKLNSDTLRRSLGFLRRKRAETIRRVVIWARFALTPVVTWPRRHRRLNVLRRTGGVSKNRASVVILSYRRPRALQLTLNNLLRTTENDRFEIEVIVVDNGSDAATVEMLRQRSLAGHIDKLILSKHNRGISEGYNLGFAYANPELSLLIKLDQDIHILSDNWISLCGDIFDRIPDAAVLALNQANHKMLPYLTRNTIAGYRLMSWNEWPCGSCMIIPRSIRQKVGHFREGTNLKYFPDDVDYYFRLRKMGLSAYYACDAMAYHCFKLHQIISLAPGLKYVPGMEFLNSKSWMALERAQWWDVLVALDDGYKSGRELAFIWYPQYDNCRFPPESRVLVL